MGRIRSLDTLKGICAIIIAVYHGFIMFGRTPLFPHGYLAVEIFFMVSGFLMMSRFDYAKLKAISYKDYFLKRFWRIYPVYFVVTIIGAIIGIYRIYIFDTFDRQFMTWLEALFLNIAVLPHLGAEELIRNGTLYPFAFQVWTIPWEFIIGMIFLVWAKFGAKHLFAIYSCLFVGFFVAIIMNPWINYHHPSLNIGWNNSTILFGAGRSILSLFCGIIAAKLLPMLPRKLEIYVKLLAVLVLFVAIYYFNNKRNNLILEYILAFVGFPIMIAGIALFKNPIVNNFIGDFFGKISYAMFMTHGFMLTAAKTFFWMFTIKGNLFVGFTWLFVTIAISYCIWRFIEKPAGQIRWGISK